MARRIFASQCYFFDFAAVAAVQTSSLHWSAPVAQRPLSQVYPEQQSEEALQVELLQAFANWAAPIMQKNAMKVVKIVFFIIISKKYDIIQFDYS